MPILGGAKGFIDLPGFDRIAEVGINHGEYIRLHGSSVRRLVQRLLVGSPVDHTLPLLCAPPPSDVDLIVSSDDRERINLMVSEIRDSAPIFQGLRVEASSLPRITELEETLDYYIVSPALQVSIGQQDEEGFYDPSGRGIEQLSERRLTFHLQDDAWFFPEQLDPEVRFHIYAAGLVFAKAAYENGSPDDFLGSQAMEFCQRNLQFVEVLARTRTDRPYYFDRLGGLAYSIHGIVPRPDFEGYFAPLLPSEVANTFQSGGPERPHFKIGKTFFHRSEVRWEPTRQSEIEQFVDLSAVDPLLSSPPISFRPDILGPNSFLDCFVPLYGLGNVRLEVEQSVSAAIRLSVLVDHQMQAIWVGAACEAATRHDSVSLRVSLDPVTAIVQRLAERFINLHCWIDLHVLGHRAEFLDRGSRVVAPPHVPGSEAKAEVEAGPVQRRMARAR